MNTLTTTSVRAIVAAAAVSGVCLAAGSARAQVRDDFVLQFNNDALVLMLVDGTPYNTSVTAGRAMLHADDPDCVPSITVTCTYTVGSYEVISSGFDFSVGGVTAQARHENQGVEGYVSAFDDGSGIAIVPSFPAFNAMNIAYPAGSNPRRISRAPSPAGITINVDRDDRQVNYFATFSGDYSGAMVEYFIDGAGTVVNLPPHAEASVDLAAGGACDSSAVATLTGVGTDPEQNELTARWLDNGTWVAGGLDATVALAPGEHEITLVLNDTWGSEDRDVVSVSVGGDLTPPEITAPPPVNASSCTQVQLGTPSAHDDCSSVEVTNDAPAQFTAGRTFVVWTARDEAGNTATATQVVNVGLGNNLSCCPAGMQQIAGTSGNDVLTGSSGPDCIFGFGGQDTIYGKGGDDLISAGDGDDIVYGGDGNDLIWGGSGQDRLYGGNGNDGVFGDDGDDKLFGDAGDDLLDGGNHQDQCTGGTGFDTMISCAAQDTLDDPGPPAFPGDPNFDVCSCQPNKCGDCASGIAQCQATSGCPEIIQCVQATSSCNLPHECSQTCESGRTPEAIQAARSLASCFGGCVPLPGPGGNGGSVSASLSFTADWGGGYCAALKVTNDATLATTSWTATVNLNESSTYTTWNGDFSSTSGTVTISPGFDWNEVIVPGASDESVGFCANRSVPNSGKLPSVVTASGTF